MAAFVFIAAAKDPQNGPPASKPAVANTAAPEPEDAAARERFARLRKQMVAEQLRGRDITDRNVLNAMARVPRHRFVPLEVRELAYRDRALPIGHAQTISQPYIVALMTQLVRPAPAKRALDIGTGSGYQAAILAELCKSVCTIEIVEPLADSARTRLAALGYKNIEVRAGDGYRGWPQRAPFDIITVAAAAPEIPKPLLAQLAPGGRLVMPVGESLQELILVEKRGDGALEKRSIAPVAFVPLTGEAQSTTKER
jgi:protein-L-isoaspartate(D-aspartate) O-methyltransferase